MATETPGEDDEEALSALHRATAIYVYLQPLLMPRLAPFLLRAVARGARVMTLDYPLPSASDAEAVSLLPSDCQPLAKYLVPLETHLFGKMRVHAHGATCTARECGGCGR